ncbi:MAG: hypothetical protein OJF50_001785 [Nitrospira sp.]|nr:hypothetical protein [Nitrospira sp.]
MVHTSASSTSLSPRENCSSFFTAALAQDSIHGGRHFSCRYKDSIVFHLSSVIAHRPDGKNSEIPKRTGKILRGR